MSVAVLIPALASVSVLQYALEPITANFHVLLTRLRWLLQNRQRVALVTWDILAKMVSLAMHVMQANSKQQQAPTRAQIVDRGNFLKRLESSHLIVRAVRMARTMLLLVDLL